MYKLIVFIPKKDTPKVKEALFKAGAGRLGEYSDCGFETQGLGQFKPLDKANPTIGSRGMIEYVEECKFETIVEQNSIEDVLLALYKSHPYEEPAFDLIELANNKFSYLKNLVKS